MCQQLPEWLTWVIPVVVLLIESWLGKTNKTKSGSILELFYNIVLKYFKYRKGESNV